MKTEKEIQQDNIQHLLQLMMDNPDCEILPMVATECAFDDSCGYWMASWGKAVVDEYVVLEGHERIYTKSQDYEYLLDMECSGMDGDGEGVSEKAIEKMNEYDWVKAIIVYIDPL